METWVEKQLTSVPGRVGFYYRNLETGETETYRSEELFQAASVIKLPILAAVQLQEQYTPGICQEQILVREGDKVPGCGALQHISGDRCYDVMSLCRLMITISDNTATNALIRRFGLERLNELFRELGLEHSRLYRLLFDAEAASQGKENLVQPLEMGMLLERIYRKTCVSQAASEQMLSLLSQQQINHKIPGNLPPGTQTAHKTGEDDGITNDVGIVFGKTPCVLAFLSNETDVPAFEQVIRTLSRYYAER